MKVVAPDPRVDGTVQLDPRHLGFTKRTAHVDGTDAIAPDSAEGSAQTAHNARVFAMGNDVAAHHVMADLLARPRDPKCPCPTDRGPIALGRLR